MALVLYMLYKSSIQSFRFEKLKLKSWCWKKVDVKHLIFLDLDDNEHQQKSGMLLKTLKNEGCNFIKKKNGYNFTKIILESDFRTIGIWRFTIWQSNYW
jgi:hypothetical protein